MVDWRLDFERSALGGTRADAEEAFDRFLHADLANPTSNHVYQEIGYRPVADMILYRFEPGPIEGQTGG